MAGTQDNGTIRYTGSNVWDHIADGDGGDCGVNQLSPNVVYHSYYNVSLERANDKGNTWSWLAPPNVPILFYPPVEVSVSNGRHRSHFPGNHQDRWSAVDHVLAWSTYGGGIVGHARD